MSIVFVMQGKCLFSDISRPEKIETLSPNLLSFVVPRMCSTIDSREKGYKLLEQILFNFLVLFPTLF